MSSCQPTVNFFALNDTKTEVICFTSKFSRSDTVTPKVRIGDAHISHAMTVKNLGVMFESDASMSTQISNMCKSASYALWRLGKIRKFIDKRVAEKLVHAFIGSRLDYCNSLLIGVPNYQLHRLQTIQNSAARLIYGIRKCEQLHMEPVLIELHWLPVAARILFKFICLIFKCIHWRTAPQYLKDLISVREPGQHHLRSDNAPTLYCPPRKTLKTYGDRAFSIKAPTVWNKLPVNLRTISVYDVFKSSLKTHLFKTFYKL